MFKVIRSHLKEARKNYWSHWWFAVKNGFSLIGIGIASIIHGFFPNFFAFHAEKKIIEYHEIVKRLQERRKE